MFGSMPDARSWAGLLLLGTVQMGIPYVLFSMAIRHVPAVTAILVPMIEPVLNPLWVLLLIGETPGPMEVAGGIVILGAVAARCIRRDDFLLGTRRTATIIGFFSICRREAMPMMRKVPVFAIVLFAAGICQAGWLEDTVTKTGKSLGNRAVNDAGSGAYKGAKDSVTGADKKPEKAPGNRPATGRADDPYGDGDVSIEQADAVYSKYDFVPGDKTIYFDDFSDTDVGEFPRKWTLNGPKEGGNNSVEVAEFQGKRYLRSTPAQKGKGQSGSTQYIRLEQKGDMPEKFTVEFDAVFAGVGGATHYHNFYRLFLLTNEKSFPPGKGPGVLLFSGRLNESANTRNEVDLVDGKPHRVQVSVNGTFVKAYVDQQRVINDPDGIKRPVKLVGIFMGTPNRAQSEKVMFTNFRVAQGGKDIKSALDTDGKIVTHGILFDTGKDVLKAESLPTLKMILGLLNGDPGLKFSIEGHTDNQGGRDINQPLSEKRAAAVRAWLSGKGIEEARLKTAGHGDSRPIDTNGTLEGRANNRRVEFVKF
jgi:OOP family OmpA-OmpF porin